MKTNLSILFFILSISLFNGPTARANDEQGTYESDNTETDYSEDQSSPIENSESQDENDQATSPGTDDSDSQESPVDRPPQDIRTNLTDEQSLFMDLDFAIITATKKRNIKAMRKLGTDIVLSQKYFILNEKNFKPVALVARTKPSRKDPNYFIGKIGKIRKNYKNRRFKDLILISSKNYKKFKNFARKTPKGERKEIWNRIREFLTSEGSNSQDLPLRKKMVFVDYDYAVLGDIKSAVLFNSPEQPQKIQHRLHLGIDLGNTFDYKPMQGLQLFFRAAVSQPFNTHFKINSQGYESVLKMTDQGFEAGISHSIFFDKMISHLNFELSYRASDETAHLTNDLFRIDEVYRISVSGLMFGVSVRAPILWDLFGRLKVQFSLLNEMDVSTENEDENSALQEFAFSGSLGWRFSKTFGLPVGTSISGGAAYHIYSLEGQQITPFGAPTQFNAPEFFGRIGFDF